MAQDNDEHNGKKRGLGAKDIALWKSMTEDVQPLRDDPYHEADDATADNDPAPRKEKAQAKTDRNPPAPNKRPHVAKQKSSSPPTIPGQDVDRRTAQRLSRGQMRPEARLDLHSYGREQAYVALHDFIRRSYACGMRCVLVITGKGRTGKEAAKSVWLGEDHHHDHGVLRREVPHWLDEVDMRRYVLQIRKARPQDGGDGALYVLLRRDRHH